ncbi:MAG: HAD family hydrolase [Bacteroidota bacterium]
MLLLLDLDDTIFATQSIRSEVVQPAIALLETELRLQQEESRVQAAITELWQRPFDAVAKKYHIPEVTQARFHQKLQSLDYELKISPFPDYQWLRQLPIDKMLVTTGITKLQRAKISALGIEADFKAVFIDDPFAPQRIYKQGIFEHILHTHSLPPEQCWVIGDNPESELRAGKDLGMNTVQRLPLGQSAATPWADFALHSFTELQTILAL